MSETRVLLVEDEPGYARFLREVLSEAEGDGYRLTWVGTLEDALRETAERSFDIVLLDLGLPDADGTEALTRVSSSAPTTPIVVLSALNDLDVALESMRVGAQEYLVKGQSEHLLLPRAMRYAMERKRLQDVLATARAEAERANAVKDEFLAMLGHELRNPLAPIVTALALMREGAGSMERERSIVERQVQHLVRLVDDLLDVSRIARGKIEIHRAEVDLSDVVGDGVETSSPLFGARHHTLRVDVPRGRLFVDGDRSRLAQVVANLLTNAAKYTNPGGRITVSAREDAGFVELRVEDDGIGMAPELLLRVFDLFEQGARPIDRSAGGLGLGLSIVRSIVALHGGSVAATSEGAGKGSQLVVRLPLASSRAPRVAPAPETRPAERRAAPLRVLVVDDNADGAELLAVALGRMGHSVEIAHDGPFALKLAKRLRPDVALLDIGLPDVDGYEVARQLRAALGAAAPKLVAVTGYGQASDRARSRDAGFDHHLVKPVDLATLEELFTALSSEG